MIDLLSHLVARSLVVAETNAGGSRYRLLETTRTYALASSPRPARPTRIDRRHAQYFRDRIARAADDWMGTPDADWRATYLPERDNVRAALNWALGTGGDRAIGIALAGASGPMWTELSLYGRGPPATRRAAARKSMRTPRRRIRRGCGSGWVELGALRRPTEAVPALQRAIVLYRGLGDARSLGFALARLAHEEAMAGRFDQAASALAEAWPLLEKRGLPKLLGDYFDYSGGAEGADGRSG